MTARISALHALPLLVVAIAAAALVFPAAPARAADEIAALEHDAILRLECPELPPTLLSM